MTRGVAGREIGAGTRRIRVGVAVGLVLAVLGARAAGAQALPAGFEQGIFELRAARIAAETVVGLLSPSGVVLVPVDRAIALTGMPVRRADSTLVVERSRNAGNATLDYRARRLTDGPRSVQLGAEDLVHVDGVSYLSTTRLAQLMGASVEADRGQLAVTMTRSPPFPVEQAAARALRTAGAPERSVAGAARVTTPFTPRTGGAVVDWTASTVRSTRSFGGSTGSLRSGAAIYGGDVAAGVTLTDDGAGGVRAGTAEWSYRRGIPGSRLVRQFQVGDVLGGGTQLRSLRGLTLTNARLASDPEFASVPVSLSLPQGWQYEVYQNGQLLGFSDAGVRAPVFVPLRYGTTPVQVRLVSPAGDETVRDFSYLIPQSQQQPGRLEYTAGGGRCISSCRTIAFGNASYGVAPWLSVSAGAERTTVDSAARLRPEGGVSILTYSGWNAQFQAAHERFRRASLLYGGVGRIVGSGSYARTFIDADQPSVITTTDQGRWLFDGQLQLRTPIDSRVSGWRLDNSLEGVVAGRPQRSRTSVTAELQGGNIGVSYDVDQMRALREAGVTALAVLPRGWHASSLLGTLLFNQRTVHAFEMSTSMQTGRRGAAALTARWQRGTGMIVSAGYNGALGAMRLTSRLAASRSRPAYLATAASGSVALDGLHRPSLFEGPGVGLGGVAGRVFYDLDADGRFGAGEQAAPGVRIIVNGAPVRSDSAGHYRAWNVMPYETSVIVVDTLAFSDFSWTLLRGRTAVRATPGMFNRVDFPLVRTRELAGQLVADSSIATVGGVSLLLESESGGATQRFVTFSDGSFYLSRVMPGRYRLSVSGASLDALGAVVDPVATPVDIALMADDPVLTLPPIRLRRRSSAGR